MIPKLINKIVIVLTISDFFLNLGWGLVSPIFAIFILNNIAFGSISKAAAVAGLGSFIFWTVKSVVQIPVGRYLDINHGEKDDFWFMVIGTFVMALVPIGYLFASQVWHIYALQALYAIAAGVNFPSWAAIFTRHIDKGSEAFQWGAHSTVLGFAAGIAGGLGGLMVALFGFTVVFIFVSLFILFAGFLLLLVKHDVSLRNKKVPRSTVERRAI